MTFDSRLLSGIGVLSAVIEAGSFARAGEALGLTQPAVSRAVARLERRIGIRIFHRNARSITLTDEGRRFFEAVQPHLAGIEDAAMGAGRTGTEVRGRLRVNVDAAFGHYVLTRGIQPFLHRYPELTVEVSGRDRIGDLVAEGFDVGLHFGSPEPSSLPCRLLARTRILTCATPGYLERHGVPERPDDIARHVCILMRDPSTGRQPHDWNFVKGSTTTSVKVTGRLIVNDTGSLIGSLLGGYGIGRPLEFHVRPFLDDGRLIQVVPEWSDEAFPLYAYHHAPKLMSAKVKAFMSFVESIVS